MHQENRQRVCVYGRGPFAEKIVVDSSNRFRIHCALCKTRDNGLTSSATFCFVRIAFAIVCRLKRMHAPDGRRLFLSISHICALPLFAERKNFTTVSIFSHRSGCALQLISLNSCVRVVANTLLCALFSPVSSSLCNFFLPSLPLV